MSRIASMREELGGAHPLAANKVKDHLEPFVRAYIENAPFAIMATSDADGNCDASPKGGKPGFVKVPLDLAHSMPITILASTVSLTPGTVSAEVYPWKESLPKGEQPQQRYLLIHVLNLEDEQALIQTIKQRYEAPLKEIFGC